MKDSTSKGFVCALAWRDLLRDNKEWEWEGKE